jgi:hypothetical protein
MHGSYRMPDHTPGRRLGEDMKGLPYEIEASLTSGLRTAALGPRGREPVR